MNKKYIEKIDSRNGKVYLTLFKSRKTLEQERNIITNWILINVSQGKENHYYKSLDIYKKVLDDTGLTITPKSFGLYFTNALKRLNIKYIKVQKGFKDSNYNDIQCYFGLEIPGVQKDVQYFNMLKRIGYGEGVLLKLGYFEKNKFIKWATNCLIINKNLNNEQISIRSLFISFCEYYNLNIEAIDGNLSRFGIAFNNNVLTQYSFIERSMIRFYLNGKQKGLVAYNCIKIK